MATIGTLTGLQSLLNQVAYNKLINNRLFTYSLLLISKDGAGLFFSNSSFHFTGE